MNILITGANRGLGYHLTTIAAQRGHHIIAGIRASSPDGQLLELINGFPGQIEAVELDVTREETIARLAEKLKTAGQTVDAIINSAGILLGRGVKLEDLQMEDVAQSFEINLFGPMRVIKHILPLMPDGASRVVINVSSEAGSMSNAYGGDYPYAISKTAINMFSKQLRKYVKGREIRVYALHPGWIKTDMGGEKAPGDPVESARGILDIVEMKKEIPDEHFFINFKGEPMPI
ncbi:SDR family oxidoreductase [Paenibacillus agricola]|uniref:SDR family oxidoreductase n=1 Tax=Paenibacillus agricola TaxID=2716264 RepID=A0ABX0JF31_9BACL|nr:SDR family oxidoreductase [Paenibacillus agricola]NHN34000.1 SDR family oxidoreductase [Paenibacillus agricola]